MELTPAERITAWLIDLPMSHGFSSARTSVALRRLVVVRLEQGGESGWGEAAPVPGHTPEAVDEVWATLRQLVAAHGTSAAVHATGLARAALQQATDDLAARQRNTPLWRALGSTQQFPAGAAIGVDPAGQPDRSRVAAAVAGGYTNMKLKITPQTEVAAVRRLVQEHEQVTFGIDANGSLRNDDLALIEGLDSLGLAYVEQPGAPGNLRFHRELRRRLQTPIALDESAAATADIDRILAEDAADMITLKTGRMGASAVLDLAAIITPHGVGVRLGGLLESGIGRGHSAAVAGHPIFTQPGDVAGSDHYFPDDLVRPQWRMEAGSITAPDRPGIGVTVDPDALVAHSVGTISSEDSG